VVALLVRIAIAAGLTIWLFWRSRPDDVLRALASVTWLPIVAAVLLVLLDRTLMAWRWLQLLCTVDARDRPTLGPLLRIFFVSTFLGTFLPASVGGDAVRAYSLSRLRVRGSDAIASVLVDRMTGLASILIMALGGLLLARDLAGSVAVLAAMGLAGLACLVFLALIVSGRTAAGAGGILVRLPVPGLLQTTGRRVVDSLRRYELFLPQLGSVLGASIGVQILRVIQAYFLGRGLGIAAPLEAYFAFIPVILLIMLLPVTINGIGTSQAAFVWLFPRADVTEPQAFALSVLFVALGVVGNLPGGVLYAAGTHSAEKPPAR
jgi:uncharacterized protein (TIRG00374 family)